MHSEDRTEHCSQKREKHHSHSDNRTYQIVDVLVPIGVDRTYRYKVSRSTRIIGGEYVSVRFGKQKTVAVIQNRQTQRDAANQTIKDADIKTVDHIFPFTPMADIQRQFINWVADYTLTPKGAVLKLALNAPDIFKEKPTQTAWTYHQNAPEGAKITPKRAQIIDFLKNARAPQIARDIIEKTHTSLTTIKKMEADRIIEKHIITESTPLPEIPKPQEGEQKTLSQEQKNAVTIIKKNTKNGFSTTLLDGVTGAGKTEVFFEVIADLIIENPDAQILILLPEIALTKPFIERAYHRFNAVPAEWHSDLTQKKRAQIWENIASGRERIIIGTRSALFLPFKNLRLIVVDEEHDPSFKQEDGVIYNARDMSVAYGALGKFAVILSSATPTLETVENVTRKKYRHAKIETRYANPDMPNIRCVDMRQHKLPPNQWIAPPIEEEIRKNIRNKEQSLLFINRRGYAPLTLCRRCAERCDCPNCKAWLVYHQKRQKLICHHCGYARAFPTICPNCSGENSMVACGPGVERLAEEVAYKFPDAQTATLSSDLLKGKDAHHLIREIVNGKYDIIIGTQIITRGHDFKHLTLAALIDADAGLEITNHRAAELAFQTITQIAGRTGRREKKGRAFIQTYNPQHPLMQAMQSGNQRTFLQNEIAMRREAKLPPFGKLAALIISAKDNQNAHTYAQNMTSLFPQKEHVILYGPAPAPISPLRNRYRYRFLIKAEKNIRIQNTIRAWMEKCNRHIKMKKDVRVYIDIDPYSFM